MLRRRALPRIADALAEGAACVSPSSVMAEGIFRTWLREESPSPSPPIRLFRERDGVRALILKPLLELLADHYVGEATVAKAGGYTKAAALIQYSLPTSKQTRSGDFGEMVATEFIDAETAFRVPIRKLRWKDDRQMAMRGNDVIAIAASTKPVRVLKCESKSAKSISNTAVSDAAQQLDAHDGRPNPSTLGFITKRLYEEDRDGEAKVFQDLMCDGVSPKNIIHAIFALSGDDPCDKLAKAPGPAHPEIKRGVAAVVIDDHSEFIEALFDVGHGSGS